jgi:hypothetical protein
VLRGEVFAITLPSTPSLLCVSRHEYSTTMDGVAHLPGGYFWERPS